MDVAPLKSYLRKVEDTLATHDATEHAQRSTLETLIESPGGAIRAINEPKRIECGPPEDVSPSGPIEGDRRAGARPADRGDSECE
jgi:hypothetical protein